MVNIIILGTCDTKLDELLFLRTRIIECAAGQECTVTLVDVGRTPVHHDAITVTQDTLISNYGPNISEGAQDISTLGRGDVIKYMTTCASKWLREAYCRGLTKPRESVHGIIGAGGTGNTSLVSAVMREVLPIGLPKFVVSTAASGETGPIVGESDITLMYSVVDIAGMNSLLRKILSNAAGAVVGMAMAYESSLGPQQHEQDITRAKRRVALTMFGVTTPCVDKVRQHLESEFPNDVECTVFHCTGHGGKAMERLVEAGELDAVIDLTTTEICDHLVGGVMSAGGARLEAALKAGIPYIISVGATDMVNFGPKPTVPKNLLADRTFLEHNPTVTLMRTSREEAEQTGRFIGEKILRFAKAKANVELVIPSKGFSMISTKGQPFHDDQADYSLISALKETLRHSSEEVALSEFDLDINDESFAVAVAERMLRLLGLRSHQ